MTRIAAREKFRWRGFEFRQSICNAHEAHWEMLHGKLRVRLVFRDIGDPESPPEWTALILLHGLAEGQGSHTGGSGIAPSAELALALAEADFRSKISLALRLSNELRRGIKPPSEEG